MVNEVKIATSKEEWEAIMELRYNVLRKPWGRPYETATDVLENNSINAYIGDSKGKVLACGRLHENEKNMGQIRFMAVHPDYRGTGLGKLITVYLENIARQKGYNKIQLQARENALEFYKRCGYQVKEKSFLLWDTIQHYSMEKQL